MPIIEVTCAIIVENRRILATRRSAEMPHPFKWEFPGGKVKKEETPGKCIKREIREELGMEMVVKRQLPPVIHHYETHAVKLIPILGTLEDGTIVLSEHQEYRWFACDELGQVDWLEADVAIVAMIRELLCQ